MGLNNWDVLMRHLREMAPGAFYDVVDAETEKNYRDRKDSKKYDTWNFVRQLPDGVEFPGVVVDLSSYVMQLISHADTGADVKRRVKTLVFGFIENHGCDQLVFCIDNKRYAPIAKHTEHDRRKAASRCEPYSDKVFCAGLDMEIDLADYDFGDEMPMPSQAERMMRTPLLMKRFYQYLATMLINEIDFGYPLQVVLCGFERESPADGQPAGERPASVWTPYTAMRRYRPDAVAAIDFVDMLAGEPVKIGEGECKAVHWMWTLFAEQPWLNSVCVRCNDTDAVVALLLNVTRVLSLGPLQQRPMPAPPQCNGKPRRRTREVWLEYSTPAVRHPRYINVTDLWRGVQAWAKKERPQDYVLHSPEALLVVAALMGGNDQKRLRAVQDVVLRALLLRPGLHAAPQVGHVDVPRVPDGRRAVLEPDLASAPPRLAVALRRRRHGPLLQRAQRQNARHVEQQRDHGVGVVAAHADRVQPRLLGEQRPHPVHRLALALADFDRFAGQHVHKVDRRDRVGPVPAHRRVRRPDAGRPFASGLAIRRAFAFEAAQHDLQRVAEVYFVDQHGRQVLVEALHQQRRAHHALCLARHWHFVAKVVIGEVDLHVEARAEHLVAVRLAARRRFAPVVLGVLGNGGVALVVDAEHKLVAAVVLNEPKHQGLDSPLDVGAGVGVRD